GRSPPDPLRAPRLTGARVCLHSQHLVSNGRYQRRTVARNESRMSLQIDLKEAAELERRFDSEMRFRPLAPGGQRVVAVLLLCLSCFHFYTAGFGLLRDDEHRGIHMSF